MKTIKIDIVSDVMCPWCIIGYKRLEQALDSISDQVSAQIHFRPFIMNPNLPEGGQNLWENTSQKYGMSVEESYASRENFINLGKELGFIYNFKKDTRMYNTSKAHQLMIWAEIFGKKNELKLAMFKAHFTDNLVMDDDSVLAQIAESVGLDKAQAHDILHSEKFLKEMLKEERCWKNAGVNSVPAFIINQKHLISGAQNPGVLAESLLNIAAKKKPQGKA